MDVEPIRIELERQQTWRQNEVRFLRNLLAGINDPVDQRIYRKSLVVMLYAHYEGFFKFAMLEYVRVINRSGIPSAQCNYSIAAASLARHFLELEEGRKKSKIFDRPLPEGDHLHRFSRRIEFIERFDEFLKSSVKVEERVVNTESNLWPQVVQKNLFSIGLDVNLLDNYQGAIMRLLNTRNSVAHGYEEEEGLDESDYRELEVAVFELMDALMEMVIDAIKKQKFLRKP